ncbi:MAG: DNA-binding LytR/AlgR family response regulator [Saprospiraceae bacterium]|jgi:DNA-binding LytR/AlgR family response regulator
MIRYLIIDDEFIAHDIIKRYCDLLPNLQLMQNCYDALEAIEYLNNHKVDLIFLDLNMPKLKGFEFLRTLPTPPKVIVTTAYKEFAIEGYELNIVDYLLKPFSFERFLRAVNKANSINEAPKTIPTEQTDKSTPSSIFLRSNKKHIQVTIDNIRYIEASGNYSKVMTTDNTIVVREKISDLILSLPGEDIIQVHKSFAVAKRHITSIEANRIFIGEAVIPVGTLYKRNVALLLK